MKKLFAYLVIAIVAIVIVGGLLLENTAGNAFADLMTRVKNDGLVATVFFLSFIVFLVALDHFIIQHLRKIHLKQNYIQKEIRH